MASPGRAAGTRLRVVATRFRQCGCGLPQDMRGCERGSVDRTRTFAVVLEPEEEGGFTVRVPSLPEIVTYGKDENEALAMAKDAIRLVLEDCLARGETIPGS